MSRTSHDKFVPGSPCPYHGSYTKTLAARYKEQIAAATGGGHAEVAAAAQLQAQARKMEPIWDIVSGLAKALTEARDQIAMLMKNQQQNVTDHSSSSTSRASHASSYQYAHARCPPRLLTSGDHSPHTNRNIHRSHARGVCAFGRNSEFKERMHHNNGGYRYSPSEPANSRGRNPGSAGENRQETGKGGSYGINLKGGNGTCGISMVPGSKTYECKQTMGKKGIHLSAHMRDCAMKVDADGSKFDGKNPVKIRISAPTRVRTPPETRKTSPEVKRYCVGTQYANLLKEEAHHLRAQRSGLELRPKNAIWNY